MPRGESERKHSLASIEPSDPLYEDVDVGGKKKRVRVSVEYISTYYPTLLYPYHRARTFSLSPPHGRCSVFVLT